MTKTPIFNNNEGLFLRLGSAPFSNKASVYFFYRFRLFLIKDVDDYGGHLTNDGNHAVKWATANNCLVTYKYVRAKNGELVRDGYYIW